MHTQIDMHKRFNQRTSTETDTHVISYLHMSSYVYIYLLITTVEIPTQALRVMLSSLRGQYRFQDYDTTQSIVEGIRASGCRSAKSFTYIFTLAWPILFSYDSSQNVP